MKESFAKFIISLSSMHSRLNLTIKLSFLASERLHANLDIMVASQERKLRNYDEWVNSFQELDSSICVAQEAHA